MRVLAPAKINLHLRVGPKQSDGFHPVATWMVTVGLFDKLDFSLDESVAGASRCVLQCDDPGLPVDQSNLVMRAIGAMDGCRANADLGRSGVRVRLSKRIPMGGGLGGGSSDAASTLMALNRLWELNLPKHRLTELAAGLGSDIAFFLDAPSAICTGRGEQCEPVAKPAVKWAVLMLPGIAMPTPLVYREFDRVDDASRQDWSDPIDFAKWQQLPAADLLGLLRNDLETPAFALNGKLRQFRSDAEALIHQPVRMSGSGSTLFTLFDDEQLAIRASENIQQRLSLETIVAHVAPDEVNG